MVVMVFNPTIVVQRELTKVYSKSLGHTINITLLLISVPRSLPFPALQHIQVIFPFIPKTLQCVSKVVEGRWKERKGSH